MKILLLVVFSLLIMTPAFSQDINGKWVGKAFQGPGELCRECNFELDLILSQTSTISGKSYHYQKDTTDIRMKLSGYFDNDTIRLRELRSKENYIWIYSDSVQACLKQYMLKYQVLNNKEYLIGRGTGKGMGGGGPCIPADFVFARTQEELEYYVSTPKDSLIITTASALPIPEFTADFKTTVVNKVTELTVTNPTLQLRLYDYLKIDNDTVSVYFNRNPLAKNVRISKQAVSIDFKLDTRIDVNELLLYAENLGQVPPNTSLLEIIDGTHTYRIKIESDKQKTAAIYLRYIPIKPK
jgi:hypothetical protein